MYLKFFDVYIYFNPLFKISSFASLLFNLTFHGGGGDSVCRVRNGMRCICSVLHALCNIVVGLFVFVVLFHVLFSLVAFVISWGK